MLDAETGASERATLPYGILPATPMRTIVCECLFHDKVIEFAPPARVLMILDYAGRAAMRGRK